MSLEGIANALRDLKQERAKLEAAIARLDAAIIAVEAVVGPLNPTSRSVIEDAEPIAPGNVSRTLLGPYTGKTIIAAATEFLRSAGRPQHISSILRALGNGGLHTNSKNLYRTVYNTLNTNLDKGISRTPDGLWGLKEWSQQGQQ